MTINPKALETIIARYGSYEEYLKVRYHDPAKAKQRSATARKAGIASHKSPNAYQPFKDKEVAREAQKRAVESRLKKKL